MSVSIPIYCSFDGYTSEARTVYMIQGVGGTESEVECLGPEVHQGQLLFGEQADLVLDFEIRARELISVSSVEPRSLPLGHSAQRLNIRGNGFAEDISLLCILEST